jgi:hypothetical protein
MRPGMADGEFVTVQNCCWYSMPELDRHCNQKTAHLHRPVLPLRCQLLPLARPASIEPYLNKVLVQHSKWQQYTSRSCKSEVSQSLPNLWQSTPLALLDEQIGFPWIVTCPARYLDSFNSNHGDIMCQYRMLC